MALDDYRWSTVSTFPPEWRNALPQMGGGFFHTPGGLSASGIDGEPFYAELRRGPEVAGFAAGVRSACGLKSLPAHVYLPTLPAIPRREDRGPGLDALISGLERDGAVAVSLDSYDSRWQWTGQGGEPEMVWLRREYVVPLAAPERMMERLATGHSRQARLGDREGWQLRADSGHEARTLLAQVQQLAADRTTTRGEGFRPTATPFAGEGGDPKESAWGSTTFIAQRGSTALAVAQIGWAAGRAFYVMGGSTAAGHRAGAGIWLHWRIMCRLADAGLTAYNLGGTPATAESAGDPAHGLYRFKMGFGSDIVPCCSARWILSPGHERLHRLGGWLSSALSL